MSEHALALVGPTASGKTAVSLALAEELDAEILCMDSMTVYRGLDIGTAKPSDQDRARVPHHLLDIADPREPFTVAMFQTAAREAVEGIRERGRTPFFVGGSGLHFRAVVDDFDFPPTDAQIRARLEASEAGELAKRLAELDPAAATAIDPANTRRVVRALEVIEITGLPFSSFDAQWDRYRPVPVAGLRLERNVHAQRARTRAQRMLQTGLLDEVRALLADGYRESLTAAAAIGYPQAIAVIEGRLDDEGFVEETARATMRYARRQMSWFRRDPRVVWFDASEVAHATGEVRAYYSRQRQGDGG